MTLTLPSLTAVKLMGGSKEEETGAAGGTRYTTGVQMGV